MTVQQSRLTDAQEHLIGALDDTAEHVMFEWDKPESHAIGTCGFARIKNIDGRMAFVQRAKSLADTDSINWVRRDDRIVAGRVAPISIDIGALDLSLSPAHDSGYTLSVTNISELVGGPAHQCIGVREELHTLVLERLRHEWGYFDNTVRVYSRVD